jgi:CO/xanthine dehydrogenase Mo-binding subunit
MAHEMNRRNLLTTGGAITVSMLLPGVKAQAFVPSEGLLLRPPLDPHRLASYISVNADGTVTAWFGKPDMGQGTDVGVAQMVAEELDIRVERVKVDFSDTISSLNQGGASSSVGVSQGGRALANAAAEARLVLLEMASKHLGAPLSNLTIHDGVISTKGDPTKSVSFGELIGGRWFANEVEWNGIKGNALDLKSIRGKRKDPSEYKVYGSTPPRRDVPVIVLATEDYVVDIKLPGMLHGRTILPPVAGSIPMKIERDSVKHIPGVQIVHENGFLGIVAPKEWDAVKAARDLKVLWSETPPPFFDQKDLYKHIRNAPVIKTGGLKSNADKQKMDEAFRSAVRVIEATYEYPFQSHACMGPGCAVVDYQPNGVSRVWTGSQKPHYATDGVAAVLGVKPENMRGTWVRGPGSYGRGDAGDAANAAAILSKAVGKPVRYQAQRHEAHGWDPKGPASIHTVRAGLDKEGKVIAWSFNSKGFDRLNVASNESKPRDNLFSQLAGVKPQPSLEYGSPQESYRFPAKSLTWELIPPMMESGSPLRTSHLRDPLGPDIHFASESFIDEVAFAVGMDPVEFRLRNLGNERDRDLIQALAEKAGWEKHTTARKQRRGDVAIGHGVAYAVRAATRVAIFAEVEVNMKTGKVWGKRFVVSHDCGIVINPDLLKLTIEGNIIQGLSRALMEETTFDKNNVTSTDWESYPILDMTERPQSVDIVLINRKNLAPTGAGEGSMRPVTAAVGNAIYDATGVRLRQAPFTPERLRAAGFV